MRRARRDRARTGTWGALLLITAWLGSGDVAHAHGGTYIGPGDTVPPGGWGGGGGGGPAGRRPAGPGPTGASTPGTPSPLGAPGTSPTGASRSGQNPSTTFLGMADAGVDLTSWEFWWAYNRAPYLNLKARVQAEGVTTGSAEFFLGEGEQDQARDRYRPSAADVHGKVVPALLEALERERSDDVTTACLIALAKAGDRRGEDGGSVLVPVIANHLADASQEVSETAVLALGILGNHDALAALVDLVRDTRQGRRLVRRNARVPVRTRAFAAYALGLLGRRSTDAEVRRTVVAGLIGVFDVEAAGFATRDVPVALLTAIGLVPLERHETCAATEGAPADTCLRTQFEWLLEVHGRRDLDPRVLAHAPTALARLLRDVPEETGLKERAVRRILPALARHARAEAELQRSAALALGGLGDSDGDELDREIRAALIAIGENVTDLQARFFGTIALAQVAGRPGRGDGEPTEGAARARSHLLTRLARGRSNVEPWAALALGVLEECLAEAGAATSADSTAALRAALGEARAPDRIGAYSIALGILHDPEAREPLLAKLERTRDANARGHVAVALGLIGATGAIEPISEVLRSSKFSPELLRSAAVGLGLLGDKTTVDDLIGMLENARGLASQASVAQALGTIGDVRSIDPLVAFLRDDERTALARAFAAAALGIVVDRDPLPWNAAISVDLNYRAGTRTLSDPAQGTGIVDIL